MTNAAGAASSLPVTVSVSLTVPSGGQPATWTWNSLPGRSYGVESSATLWGSDRVEVGSVSAESGTAEARISAVDSGVRFFHVRPVPLAL